MRPIFLALALALIAAACAPLTDDRSNEQRAATQTARAALPVSGNVGVLRIRLRAPLPPVEPAIAPPTEQSLVPTVTLQPTKVSE